VITHTDGGSEYCSRTFQRACRELGITQSTGRVGSCFGHAVSEAFNSVLKVEYVHWHTFATRTEARIIDYERDNRATLTEGLAA
jgi:transposase InsO family protein